MAGALKRSFKGEETEQSSPDGLWSPRGGGGSPPVVVLADLAHGHQGLQVLVGLVGVNVVQRAAVTRVPVGGGEVDGHLRREVEHRVAR